MIFCIILQNLIWFSVHILVFIYSWLLSLVGQLILHRHWGDGFEPNPSWSFWEYSSFHRTGSQDGSINLVVYLLKKIKYCEYTVRVASLTPSLSAPHNMAREEKGFFSIKIFHSLTSCSLSFLVNYTFLVFHYTMKNKVICFDRLGFRWISA